MGNTLCNGRVKNNNPNSPIDYFLLVTVREYSDYEGGTYIDEVRTSAEFLEKDKDSCDDPFYQVYGSVPIFLGEFYSIDKARNFLYNLTGEVPQIISY